MSVSTETLAEKFLAPATGVPIDVSYPCFAEGDVVVLYGVVGLVAVLDTDYTVALNDPTFEDFDITPLASLRVKIDALLVADPTETDQIVVRRSMSVLTDMDSNLARYRASIALEFDRLVLMAQELKEGLGRSLRLANTDVSGASNVLPTVPANLGLKRDAAGTAWVATNTDPDTAGEAAETAQAAAELAQTNAETAETNAETAQAAAETAQTNAETAETNAETAQTNAETAETNAETAETNAEAAQTGAQTAQGAAEDAIDASGILKYVFDDNLPMVDPGAGEVRFNHGTVASVTALAFSNTTSGDGTPDVSDFLASLDDVVNSVGGAVLTLRKLGSPGIFVHFNVTAVADNTSWLEFNVTHRSSSGTWTAADAVMMSAVINGADGIPFDLESDPTPVLGAPLDTGTFAIDTSRATVPSHATTSAIWAAGGNEIDFTGTATITDFPAAARAGAMRVLHCAAACTFTHAGSITVQGAVSYTAAAGDIAFVHAITTGTFAVFILKADGTAVVSAGGGGLTLGTEQSMAAGGDATFTGIPAGTTQIFVNFTDISATGNTTITLRLGDIGGLETSGYRTSLVNLIAATAIASGSSTSHFVIGKTVIAADLATGHVFLTLKDSSTNEWSCSTVSSVATTKVSVGGGNKTLTGELTQLEVSSTTASDSGTVNISYS
ncbi:MAG: hypothetical protein KAR40_15360 [Candidatus Sabulitectum sp.]|nr:hypothetical protein [Candidatus Sabulitectum sp.]